MSEIGMRRLCELALGAIAFSTVSLARHAIYPAVLSDRLALPVAAPVLSQAAESSETILIPGTSVSLVPPAGFVLSEQFSGLINEDNSSSITLTELPPAAYAEVLAALSSTPAEITELFARQGIVLAVDTVSSITVNGTPSPFVTGIQTVNDTQIQKYFVLLGEESTVLLTFNIFDQNQLSEDTVIETIQSVEISAAPSIQEKVAELPFIFATAEPFEVFDVLFGSTVLLSPEGDTDLSEAAPLIIIANSIAPAQTRQLSTYATDVLLSTDGFADITITEQFPIEFAGDEGYFIQGTLQSDVVLQFLTIGPDSSHIRMVVIANAADIEQIMPVVETIQRSVAPK